MLVLAVLAGVLALESVRRLFEPPEVEGGLVIVVGVLGALVNVASAWALSRSERRGLNVEGALAHVLTDLYGSVAAVVAGVLIVMFSIEHIIALAKGREVEPAWA